MSFKFHEDLSPTNTSTQRGLRKYLKKETEIDFYFIELQIRCGYQNNSDIISLISDLKHRL